MESGCYLTKRGRRMVRVTGVAACWVAAFTLLTLSAVLDLDGIRGFGVGLCAIAAAGSVCLAISKQTDLVREAFNLGKEVGGREQVRQLRR